MKPQTWLISLMSGDQLKPPSNVSHNPMCLFFCACLSDRGFLVLSPYRWTAGTFVCWRRTFIKSAGKQTARGESSDWSTAPFTRYAKTPTQTLPARSYTSKPLWHLTRKTKKDSLKRDIKIIITIFIFIAILHFPNVLKNFPKEKFSSRFSLWFCGYFWPPPL